MDHEEKRPEPAPQPRRELGKLFEALSKAQGEFPEIKKDKRVKVRTKDGGQYEYSYADLSSIHKAVSPVLSKHHLCVTQTVGAGFIKTILGHSSGQYLSEVMPMSAPSGRPQDLGSLITYYRRYQLSAILGISSEDDDDGNAAQGNDAKQEPKANGNQQPKNIQDQKAAQEAKKKKKVTENQLKRLRAICANPETQWTQEQLDEIKDHLGVKSFKDIMMNQYDWLVKRVQESNFDDTVLALGQKRGKNEKN